MGYIGTGAWWRVAHAKPTCHPSIRAPTSVDAWGAGPAGWMYAVVDEGPGASDPLGLEKYCNASAYFATIAFDHVAYPPCSDAQGNVIPIDDDSWTTQKSSPWNTPRQCVWPIDSSDSRLCTLADGIHSCSSFSWDSTTCAGVRGTLQPANISGPVGTGTTYPTCASSYDRFGNERFVNDRFMARYEASWLEP